MSSKPKPKKITNLPTPSILKSNWLTASPSELADSFYTSESTDNEPLRIMSTSFKIGNTFYDELNKYVNSTAKDAGISLKFIMGINDSEFCPYIGLWDTNSKKWFGLNPSAHQFEYQLLKPSGKELQGVSPTYKNEVCASWLKLHYSKIVDSLYSTGEIRTGARERIEAESNVGSGNSEKFKLSQDIGPKRVQSFIIPNFDINVIMDLVRVKTDNQNMFINVYYGFSQGNINFKGVGFTPVFEIGLKTETASIKDNLTAELDEDNGGGTLFDFVHANPPYDDFG